MQNQPGTVPQKGGTPKPAGFWEDSRTQAILKCYISTVISDSQASEILRASASDIKHHAKKTKNKPEVPNDPATNTPIT